MELPRIAALDLRPPRAATPKPHMEWEWDWPELPRFLKRRVIMYTIEVDTSRFHAALDRMLHDITIIDHLNRYGTAKVAPRSMRQWYWHRIALWLGVVLAIGTCIGVWVDAWL